MISKSNFATMPPNARGYTAGRYGGREDQPRLFNFGYRDGQQARREMGEA
jgi:hypothetical protein